MALINCPECGKQISDKALSCPGCGCPIANNPDPSSNDSAYAEQINTFIESKKKILILLGSIIIAIILLIAVKNLYSDNAFDTQEKYVLDCVDSLLSYSHGHSIVLCNDILYDSTSKNTYVVIEYIDDYGRDTAYFKNKVYQGTASEYEESGHGSLSDDQIIAIAEANVQIASWNVLANLGDPTSDDRRLVDASKIAKKLKLKEQ